MGKASVTFLKAKFTWLFNIVGKRFKNVPVPYYCFRSLQNEAHIMTLQVVSSRRFVEIVVVKDAEEQDSG